MTPLTQAAAGAGATNPLDEIRDVGNGVNAIDQNLNQLRMLQDRALNETDSSSGTSRQLDQLTAETMANYRGLVQRLKELKGNKQAQSYRGQIDRLDRQLKERIQQYQQLEASHRQKMQGQMERQYRIVRPDADVSEVRAAVEDMSAGGQQVFQQAMMQSNRQGQARAVLNEVQNRHQELLKIEAQMTELTNMIIDLDTIIVQQEPMVQQIDEHVEKTQEDLKQANVELDTAVDTARSTRKKKWICCGICGKSMATNPSMGDCRDRKSLTFYFSCHCPRHRHHRRRLLCCHQPEQVQQLHHHRKAKLGRHAQRACRVRCLLPVQNCGQEYCWSSCNSWGFPRSQCRQDRHTSCHQLRRLINAEFRGWGMPSK